MSGVAVVQYCLVGGSQEVLKRFGLSATAHEATAAGASLVLPWWGPSRERSPEYSSWRGFVGKKSLQE